MLGVRDSRVTVWSIGPIYTMNISDNDVSCDISCRLSSGTGKDKKAKKATCAEFRDCIKAYGNETNKSQPIWTAYGYNCQDWVRDALYECCLKKTKKHSSI